MTAAEPGLMDGKHYTEYVRDVEALQKEGRLDEAQTLLLRLLAAVENEAVRHSRSVAPWYYTRLAINYRKMKRYSSEVAIIERYLEQPFTHDPEMRDRLAKARALAARSTAQEEVAATAVPAIVGDPAYRAAIQIGPGVKLGAFIDVETTGLSRTRDEVVELAVSLFTFEADTGAVIREVDRYVGLREPSIPILSEAQRIHGISMAAVRGKRLDDQLVINMLASADILIAHNASFDSGFVGRLYPLTRRKPWYCSMNGINWRDHGYPSKGLQNILSAHGIHPRAAHWAGGDVDAALELLTRRSSDGQSYLGELLHGAAQPARAAKRRAQKWEHAPEQTQRAAGCFTMVAVLVLLAAVCGFI